ncbi:MAG: hypothetical protein GY863_06885 [bacterium]|nr:hypothetical protein [bacterium]
MNTALDIIGSAVIGSILLLAILGLLFSVNDSSLMMGRSLIAQQKAGLLFDMFTLDFNKAGIAVPDSIIPVITADSMTFVFMGDIDGSGTPDSVRFTVHESADSSGNTTSSVIRRVNTGIVDEYVFRNVSARFKYYDFSSNETNVPGDVYSIETSLLTEDDIEYKDNKALGLVQWRVFLKNIKR